MTKKIIVIFLAMAFVLLPIQQAEAFFWGRVLLRGSATKKIPTPKKIQPLKPTAKIKKNPITKPKVTKKSTGRTKPNNLKEKLAMKQVKSNPQGFTPPRMPKMSDAKNGWYAKDGWVKRTQNVNGVEIHYIENTKTGKTTDFKFKD